MESQTTLYPASTLSHLGLNDSWDPDKDWSVAEAYAYCRFLAENHYENFPVGSRWIRRSVRPHVHAVYAFARTADDFADETQHAGSRLERLSHWRELLADAARGVARHPIFVALSHTIREKKLPCEWLDQLIQAFEQDVRKNRHPNFESLVEYARFSANPVGRIVLWLHDFRSDKLMEKSDWICSALQFANFWQDVAVDWDKNRVYLPQDELARFGYREKDLEDHLYNDAFRRLMKHQVDRTWTWFHNGRDLCDSVTGALKIELRLVWNGGTRILEKLERNRFDVFQDRPSLVKLDKFLMLKRSLMWTPGAS